MSAGMSICETATTTSTLSGSVAENNNNGVGNGTYTTQNNLLLKNLLKFYEKGNNLDTMLKIINGHSNISLRIIDWFATNYAKKYYTVYTIQNTLRRFKVYVDYKLKLKAYSKKRFDPFCRWDRISVPYKEDKDIETTIGQLNFFKWAISNNIIECVEKHHSVIIESMNKSNKEEKIRKKKKKTSTSKSDEIKSKLSLKNKSGKKTEPPSFIVEFD